MAFFEWGVAFHDMDLEAIRKGEKTADRGAPGPQGHRRQGAPQIVKDYVAWPLVTPR